VTPAADGYRLCADDNGSETCDALTGFRADDEGKITNLEVNGQLVSPRLAAAPDSAGAEVALSDALAYRLGSTGQVVIIYRARNITSHVVGEVTPAFLAVFDPDGGGQTQQDDDTSVDPGVLQPGETVIAYASFAAPAVTGQFSLRPNGEGPAILAATTLHPVTAPPPPQPWPRPQGQPRYGSPARYSPPIPARNSASLPRAAPATAEQSPSVSPDRPDQARHSPAPPSTALAPPEPGARFPSMTSAPAPHPSSAPPHPTDTHRSRPAPAAPPHDP
jgi:hypothetical protein